MKNELDRLKTKLSGLTPGTEEYERTLSEIERVTKLVRQEELDVDKRIREQKQLELDEKKFQHEKAKFEHQVEEDHRRNTLEEEKARSEAAEREYEHSVRYTGRQITKRIIELGAETACTAVLIGIIGNLEQSTILSKTAMMFVRKH